MRILFVIRSLGNGGAERQLTVLAKGLKRRGHHIEVVTLYKGGRYESALRFAGIPVHTVDKRGRYELIRASLRLVRIIRLCEPDVIYSFMTSANIFVGLLKRYFKECPIVWGIRASALPAKVYGAGITISLRVENALVSSADAIIANSDAGRQDAIARGFPIKKVFVVPNGIDVEHFRPDQCARKRGRVLIGASQDEFLVGIIGRLDPMKDHSTFFRAAQKAIAAAPKQQFRFLVVGDGDEAYGNQLRELAAGLGIDKFVSWVPAQRDLLDVYNALDLLVSSSSFGEGFSNVIGEAMACGLPCVVTDVGDSAAVVGEAGIVCPPRDFKCLAHSIVEMSLGNACGLSQAARARIAQKFSVDRLVADTEKVLEEVR